MRNVATPLWSGGIQSPYRKNGPIPQRAQDGQEANAGSRKAGGIHNPPDRAIPTPKGGRRGRVARRSDEGMSAYPEEKLDTHSGKRNSGTPIPWCAINALE